MRKLEEAARLEKEQREREEQRKAEIERIMQEEKQNQVLQKLAEEKAMKDRMAEMEAEKKREQKEAEEAARLNAEKEKQSEGEGTEHVDQGVQSSEAAQEPGIDKMTSTGAASNVERAQETAGDNGAPADESVVMQTYTPFDMTAVDQTARYMATKCGCSMNPTHKVSECAICGAIDLSDAPLIA